MTTLASRAARLRTALVIPAFAIAALACDDSTGPDGPGLVTAEYSFEQGLGDWEARATDIVVGGEEIDWSVTTVDTQATEGSSSAQFMAENLTDAAKVWIERDFQLEPNTLYDVDISFDFGTADWGDVNLWTIMAGALAESPQETADLQPTFRGNTGHEEGEDAGVVWLEKSYEVTATTDADGVLHVVIGVWGTFEVTRTYWVDDLRLVFTPRL